MQQFARNQSLRKDGRQTTDASAMTVALLRKPKHS